MPLPHKLYAVVSHGPQPVIRRNNPVEIRGNTARELETKKAIDRANTVLDRMEQRAAAYDAQIQLIREQYLKPLEQRRAGAQQRIDRLEDQILAKLSQANLERVDGFCRALEVVSCPKAVQVDSLALIPNEYIRKKLEPDKVAIKHALERDSDLVIPGVHLTQKLRLVRE